ncbi:MULTISPECIES: glycoside hydrolase family 30 beta sandwich domain-containing protein [unclassified Flavobacterium]|uniref:glycoside hydrolase family 30 protein n=1 Tax=unclassified Flavobacterium TaxID=196869 RepID=UPI001F12BD78|nr:MULTISPECIES: glycoside hydrolase family 30 beta sandwich domain-containing protein [unclassified Flavobacterium]UMY65515.1 glucosylceramidase [Flavobacterium sp. HJ-32-4]
MKAYRIGILALTTLVTACSPKLAPTPKTETSSKATVAEFWLTTPDKSVLFSRRPDLSEAEVPSETTIAVDASKTYQDIDGFGLCLTGGSAQLISRMSPEAQAALLQELFGTDGNHIGLSVLRLSIGSSDLDDRIFSYDDLPVGQTDPELQQFSIENDRRTGLIKILKKIKAINPSLYLMGSPWSAPTWMKTNGYAKGGSLKPEYFPAYAQYFVKYIKAMEAEGLPIDAITIQNEPLHPGNTPSMYMEAKQQALFVSKHLGPAFAKAGIRTKIILYDHNCDRPDYPISILDDPSAKAFSDGSAFHLYGGSVDALTKVHDAHPDRNLYFTEQWTGGPGDFPNDLKWNVENLTIGASRNWSRMVLQWNLASDPQYNPHTDDGGCTSCMGAITLDGDNVKRNVAYYHLAHAAKFVRRGSKRIESNLIEGLPNVAFLTPDGKKVVIVVNTSTVGKGFSIAANGRAYAAYLGAGAVGTFILP